MGEFDALVAVFQVGIGAFFNMAGYFRLCGAAVRRIVLKAAIARGIVRGGNDNAIGQTADAARVPLEHRMRNGGRGRVGSALRNAHGYVVGHQHFKRRAKGRLGKGVRVAAQKQRAVNTLGGAVVAHGLGNGVDVLFVKAAQHRSASVPRSAE